MRAANLFELIVSACEGEHKVAGGADTLDHSLLPGGFQWIQRLAPCPDGPCRRRLPLQGCFLLRRPDLLRYLQRSTPFFKIFLVEGPGD